MSKFTYEAKKGPKEIVKGTIEAESKETAVDKLNKMGYIPVRVIPAVGEPSGGTENRPANSIKRGKQFHLFKRVKARELTVFIEQLASLVKSKIPLLEVINILFEQTENLYLKEIIFHLQNEIKEGSTLSQSLRKYPHVFPALYINMINSGEAGGVLEQTLMRLVDFRNKEEEIKARILAALVYPIFIVMVGLITVFVLLAFVIPRLTVIFTEMEQELPFLTRILISLSDAVKNYWHLMTTIIVAAIFMFRRSGILNRKKIIFDKIKLKLPLIGSFVKKSTLARFSRTLAALLANGIPLFQAIQITIPTLNNEVFMAELEKVRKDILNGASLEQSLRRSKWFPRFMINVLAVGEKGGRLKESLLEAANFYGRDIDRMTKAMTSLIEPVIILLMGLAVGFIIFAMILPIFQMNMGIK